MSNRCTRLFIQLLCLLLTAAPVMAQTPQPAASSQKQDQPKQPETMPLPKPDEVLPQNDNNSEPPAEEKTLPDAPSSAPQDQQQPAQQQPTVTPVPVDNSANNPDAEQTPAQQPEVTPAEQDQTQTVDAPSAVQQKTSTDQKALGAAAARKAPTSGGAASRPAGVAIAPAKQKQSRSLLIKLGAIAAGAAALGTVYALTRKTGPIPPNAVR